MKTLKLLCCSVVLVAGVPAWADGLGDLEAFLRQTQQGKTTFNQVVTAPQKAGETARSKRSSGTFEFQRPNRFRFDYTQPFEQTIVADGQTLWLYDADLNQVTARKQQEVLGNTPAALIASAPDLSGLKGVFTLSNAPDAAGQQWVLAEPKTQDGQLQSIRLGFRSGQLATLEMLDSFGQRSVMSFGAFNGQPGFKPGHFQFKPPAGADVLRP
ncbi:MAG TPA: outer membrane lipoprotein chaperone LolA [Burkholderiaceae bacterium]|nr:outer membrane lipoprotein chaperone LolA [Burkholderiaceae bacterium]